MKTKVLIVGILLSALIIGGIGGVSGQSTISANDTEYLPSEHVGASGYCESAGGDYCDIYVCPCGVIDDGYLECEFGYPSLASCDKTTVDAGPYTVDLGPASDFGGACECFDLIIDYDAGGAWDEGDMSPGFCGGGDAIDDTGFTTSGCGGGAAGCADDPTAGFHVTPEPAAVALFAAGLATLYGFARVRRKK